MRPSCEDLLEPKQQSLKSIIRRLILGSWASISRYQVSIMNPYKRAGRIVDNINRPHHIGNGPPPEIYNPHGAIVGNNQRISMNIDNGPYGLEPLDPSNQRHVQIRQRTERREDQAVADMRKDMAGMRGFGRLYWW
jgi:hypothetical protein